MGYDSVQFALETSDVVGFTDVQRLALEMQVLISISNEATWLYKNLRYPRYRNFYGYCQLMAGPYVVQSIKLEYLNQELFHWDQCCTDLNQSIGCTGKKILANLTPPVTSVVTVYLKRQRYTSIRFRLLPGITANVTLNWRTVEQLCDEELLAPPEENGKTPLNNNRAPTAPNRPSSQPQDPRDRSKNDGNDNPNDDRPHEPVPGDNPSVPGQWYVIYSGFNAGCDGTYSNRRYALPGATNGLIPCSEGPHSPGTCGGGSYNADVLYGGAVQFRAADVTSQTFEFVPGS